MVDKGFNIENECLEVSNYLSCINLQILTIDGKKSIFFKIK